MLQGAIVGHRYTAEAPVTVLLTAFVIGRGDESPRFNNTTAISATN